MLVFSNNDASKEDKPISSKLHGIIHLPKDFDYKKELEMRNRCINPNCLTHIISLGLITRTRR